MLTRIDTIDTIDAMNRSRGSGPLTIPRRFVHSQREERGADNREPSVTRHRRHPSALSPESGSRRNSAAHPRRGFGGRSVRRRLRRFLSGRSFSRLPRVADAEPLDPSTLTHAVSRIAKGAGLDGVRLHDLRHAVATILAATGKLAGDHVEDSGARVDRVHPPDVHPSGRGGARSSRRGVGACLGTR